MSATDAILERTPPAAESRDDSAKRRQIVEGARRAFLQFGFDGTSMNEIAREAGVSKGTLYVYFDSKETLFEALVREDRRHQAEQIFGELEQDDPDMAAVLQRVGVRFLGQIMLPSTLAYARMIFGVAARLPRIGQAFYEAGPAYGTQKLSAYFARRIADGRFPAEDTELAAERFKELCLAKHAKCTLLNASPPPSVTEIDAHVADTVQFFLRAYGARTN